MSKSADPPSAPPLPAARRKVFDVTKPGHAPANATARPVIVGHGSHQADPLLAEKNTGLPSFAAGDEYLNTRKNAAADSPEHGVQVAPVAGSSGSFAAADGYLASRPQTEEPASVSAPAADAGEGDQALVSAPDASGSSTPPVLAAPKRPAAPASGLDLSMTIGDAATNAVLAGTVAPDVPSPRIIVSHHRPQRRVSWWTVMGMIVVLVVLAVAVLDLLLDAQIVKTSLNVPHTHFIK